MVGSPGEVRYRAPKGAEKFTFKDGDIVRGRSLTAGEQIKDQFPASAKCTSASTLCRPLVSISSPLRGGQYKILAADPSGIVERCPDGARFHPPVLH